jgi:hypothetical protein
VIPSLAALALLANATALEVRLAGPGALAGREIADAASATLVVPQDR